MLRIIATFRPLGSKQIVGYRLLVEDKATLAKLHASGYHFRGNVGDFSPQETFFLLVNFGSINASVTNNQITLLDGSMDSLPILNPQTGQCTDNNNIIVLAAITYNDEVIGYRVCNYTGAIAQLRYNDLLTKAKQGFANAKIVHRDGKAFISAIRGTFPTTPLRTKDDHMPRAVIPTGSNYQTLVDTTKQRGNVSIPVKYYADPSRMQTDPPTSTGHVALTDKGEVVYRYRNEHGDPKFAVVPKNVFNTNFQLGVASSVTKQELANTPPAPAPTRTNTKYLREVTEKYGIGTTLNVLFFQGTTKLAGQVRLNRGVIHLRYRPDPNADFKVVQVSEVDFDKHFRIQGVIQPRSQPKSS